LRKTANAAEQNESRSCQCTFVEILESFEYAVRVEPTLLSQIFDHNPDLTVYERAENLMAGRTGVVGRAINALKEAYYGPLSDRLLLISYERLVEKLDEAIEQVYAFIGEPHFRHDFSNVQFERAAFDQAIGAPGLHTVRNAISKRERPKVLPFDLIQRFSGAPFWTEQNGQIAARKWV